MTTIPFCGLLSSTCMASWLVTVRVHCQAHDSGTSEEENMDSTISEVKFLYLVSSWSLRKPVFQHRAFIYICKIIFLFMFKVFFLFSTVSVLGTWWGHFQPQSVHSIWRKSLSLHLCCFSMHCGQVTFGKPSAVAYTCWCAVSRRVL